MNRAYLAVAVMLVACGGVGGTVATVPDAPAEAVLEAPDGGMAPDAAPSPPDAADAAVDARAVHPDAAVDHVAVCRAHFCENHAGGCGLFADTDCGGSDPIDCGGCKPGDVCGDSDPNVCGHFCADITTNANRDVCARALAVQTSFIVSVGCHASPYEHPQDGMPDRSRPDTAGCVGAMGSNMDLLCCP